MRNQLRLFVLGATILLFAPELSRAAELGMRSFGLRGGVSTSPDQFLGGVFFNAGQLVSNLRLSVFAIEP